jgi:hypothetical protein
MTSSSSSAYHRQLDIGLSNLSPSRSIFGYSKNDLAMGNTADVTGTSHALFILKGVAETSQTFFQDIHVIPK